MIDLSVLPDHPVYESGCVYCPDGHTVATKFHEGTIVGRPGKIVKSFQSSRALRDLIEAQIGLHAQLYTYFIALLVPALGFTEMHSQTGFSLE